MMIFTGVHWASMPPSRVETIDPRTLHISGEFVESNLGTAVEADGKVVVRLVAQQYSFEPQCMLVPAETPVTFRGTSSDVIHGFVVGTTNANVMLIPGYVATFTATFRKAGRAPDAVPRVLRTAHAAMWARFQVVPQQEFMAKPAREKG
jgi:cytochrome c oxidase subunit 2